MNPSEAEKQIAQMIEFIRQEAREKAEEISVKTDAEFNAKKLILINQARMELKEEYAKKRKEASAKKRIARSRLINEARLSEMRERDQILKELKEQVLDQLAEVSKHAKYAELIKALLVQGLFNIMESKVEVRCRQVDLEIVKGQINSAVEEFKALVHQECGQTPKCEVILNTSQFLAPPRTKGAVGQTCCGGVVLAARFGKILCRNTLDSRFELAYEKLLPVTREMIFGLRASARKPAKVEAKHHH